jgi:non-ribosomal peptide synthetase component F
MTMLAAFQILLYRISGEEDIVVGTDSANRSHLETEGLIGFFINLLALRTNLSGNPKFISVLRDIRKMVLGAYMHQELPFEMVVEHLRLKRDSNRTPLVNVLFVVQNVPSTQVVLPDIQIQPFGSRSTFAKFDLALFISEDSQGLSGSVNYSTDLFEEGTIAILMQRYEALLKSIVAQPNAQVTGLEIATNAEKTQRTGKQTALRENLKRHRGERLQALETNNHKSTDRSI